jgi:hypothetical protein
MVIADMPEHAVRNVQTKPVGFAPILSHYFKKCGLRDIIDEHVPTDPRRKVLTHGQACIAMITGAMIREFHIKTDVCHNDATCAFMYGDADNRRSAEGIKITFGYSKQYRDDLKQLVRSLSVSTDNAFPLQSGHS